MNNEQLMAKLKQIADECDTSDRQQAVKSVLYGLLGAMCAEREIALMNHQAQFSQAEITRLRSRYN